MELFDINALVTVNEEKHELVFAENMEQIVDFYEQQYYKGKDDEAALREAIRKAMYTNHIDSTKIGKYSFSLKYKSSIWTFDEEKFIKEQDKTTRDVFVETTVTEEFDLEKFREENPEMFERYVTRTRHQHVNTTKLWKKLPDLYLKYATETKSSEEPTIAMKVKEE